MVFIAMVIMLFITACDDKKDTTTEPSTYTSYGYVSGTVMAPTRAPLPGVTVSIGTKTTTTNSSGEFLLSDIPTGTLVLVNFEKAGYIGNQKVVTVQANRTTFVESILFVPTTSSFPSSQATTLSDSGSSIMIPNDAFVTSEGTAFSGTVYSEIKFFDPTNLNDLTAFPGNFSGIQTDGTETMFESFGFVSAQFFDAANPQNELQLAAGKTATLYSLIPYSVVNNAPETIPMWYYDESTGKWMEQGVATKNSIYYEGTVSHFSYWNFDNPIVVDDQSTLTGRVMTADRSEPIAGAQVVATGQDYAGYTRVYSDAQGYFSISVKASAQVKLQAFSGQSFSQQTGIINTPTSGGTFEIGILSITDLSFTLTGKLIDSGGLPISSQYGMIFQVNPPQGQQAFQSWINLQSDGSFSTTANYYGTATSISVMFSIYVRNQLYSNVINLPIPQPGNIHNFGNVTMRPGGNITGVLKDNNGNLITDVWISFFQENGGGEGNHFSGNVDSDGNFVVTGPPNQTLTNMRASVYINDVTYTSQLMTLSFPASGANNNIGVLTVYPPE